MIKFGPNVNKPALNYLSIDSKQPLSESDAMLSHELTMLHDKNNVVTGFVPWNTTSNTLYNTFVITISILPAMICQKIMTAVSKTVSNWQKP